MLAGLASELKGQLADIATDADLQGWLITLQERATYTAIMRSCENRTLREELFTAYNTRASEQGPAGGQYGNGPVLHDLLRLRQQKARLLGYDSHAELSLQGKTATSVDEVLSFLRTRIERKSAFFSTQTAELNALASAMQYDGLKPWDLLFLAQKRALQLSPLAGDQLKSYFAFTRVFEGIVLLVKRLFAVDLVEQVSFDTWHPDVRLFEVVESGVRVGHLYLDPYLRESKPNMCWMQYP